MENTLDYFSADALLLIRFVHDHIPNRRSVYEIREDSAESDQVISVPCTHRHIGMP